jgi:hypothetical protein
MQPLTLPCIPGALHSKLVCLLTHSQPPPNQRDCLQERKWRLQGAKLAWRLGAGLSAVDRQTFVLGTVRCQAHATFKNACILLTSGLKSLGEFTMLCQEFSLAQHA